MSHSRTHRSTGIVAQSSGAAVAALKLRAAEWELPVEETPGRLSFFVWGCELRLTIEADHSRIDLSGPEARFIGSLRDTATEVLESEGLQISWDNLDVGALAPGLSLMRVVSVRDISPGFIRVRVRGNDAARFATGNLHFRLLLPPSGRVPVWPRVAETGRTVWPDGADAMHRPVYTVAKQSDDWVDFDIFRHENSPTCNWALSNPVGSEVGLLGPGGGWCPDANRIWLYGDETAQPAIARILELARGEAQVTISSCSEDLGGLAQDARITRHNDLLAALLGNDQIATDDYVWFAGSAEQAKGARKYLLERGHSKKNFLAAAYWG